MLQKAKCCTFKNIFLAHFYYYKIAKPIYFTIILIFWNKKFNWNYFYSFPPILKQLSLYCFSFCLIDFHYFCKLWQFHFYFYWTISIYLVLISSQNDFYDFKFVLFNLLHQIGHINFAHIYLIQAIFIWPNWLNVSFFYVH